MQSSAQRSGSGAASTPPATPPDMHSAAHAAPSPAMQVARGPVLKVTPKVTPKLRNRTTDSQMHAEASLLRPQSPPSLRIQDQPTDATLVSSSGRTEGGAGGMDGGMEDLLLQQVTALLSVRIHARFIPWLRACFISFIRWLLQQIALCLHW